MVIPGGFSLTYPEFSDVKGFANPLVCFVRHIPHSNDYTNFRNGRIKHTKFILG